ncbi:MAG: Eco57I restriction-modification methylase domain-containing protein [Flavobacteriales bacterium]|nr:Eco57I restriction-modification methylase domain-containing protein [Flavobacteriales bacterium]
MLKELPSNFADRLGIEYAASVSKEHKKTNGQFFTPVEIVSFMASYSNHKDTSIRILDPGCGSGILSCSLVENLVNSNGNIQSIELVVYESDSSIISTLETSLKYLKDWCSEKEVKLTISIYSEDFILHNSDCFSETENLFTKPIELFDIVISNPPYFKLSVDDKRAIAAKSILNGHPNIYAIFMALSAKLLNENGELIFITPRSYASGGYFKTFREFFFNLIDLENVHLFVSRKDTFKRDKVLQETVIIKGTRRSNINYDSPVTITSSGGLKDLETPYTKVFPKKDIIDLNSEEKILYLPTNDFEESVLDIFKNWGGSLSKYNIKISTGPVVAFRSREHLREVFQNGTVHLAPLFWLHNVKQMVLEWPIIKPQKEQYINIEDSSKSVLIPNKNYILLRRFSTKDDKNRLIAAPYFCNFIKSEYIGVENKVNYIYRPNGHLERNEVVGLCALLNSSLFDAFFRIFNGNVNVSATELKAMTLPPLEIIQEIGDNIILSNNFDVKNTNKIVNEYFEPVHSK